MNKRELEILKIGFEAGKKAIEMHPDDDGYDTIRFDEALQQVKKLHIFGVSASICQHCGEQEGKYCINPYKEEIGGVEEWEYICDDCYGEMVADI